MEISSSTKQLLVASAQGWKSVEGKLELFEFHDEWKKVDGTFDVVFGKNGLIEADQKMEGDGKSPVGQFKLGKVYGHGDRLNTKMPYEQISKDLEAVDDPKSKYYNQIVKRSKIVKPDWISSEQMHVIDVYDIAIFVEHNWPKPRNSGGSAIFIHRWYQPGSGTGGCTAMAPKDLAKIVAWLDPTKQPTLIQKIRI